MSHSNYPNVESGYQSSRRISNESLNIERSNRQRGPINDDSRALSTTFQNNQRGSDNIGRDSFGNAPPERNAYLQNNNYQWGENFSSLSSNQWNSRKFDSSSSSQRGNNFGNQTSNSNLSVYNQWNSNSRSFNAASSSQLRSHTGNSGENGKVLIKY